MIPEQITHYNTLIIVIFKSKLVAINIFITI